MIFRAGLNAVLVGVLLLVTLQWETLSGLSVPHPWQTFVGFGVPFLVFLAIERVLGRRHAEPQEVTQPANLAPSGVGEILGQIAENARNVNQASKARKDQLHNLMQTATELQEAMRKLQSDAGESRGNLERSTNAASQIVAATNAVSTQMSDNATMAARLKDGVNTFSESCHAIEELADRIRSIAGKTGILAVNASIEASRAGEVGAGFAVVAQQVGELARTTNGSASDVFVGIEGLQKGLAATNESIQKMQECMDASLREIEVSSVAAGDVSKAVDEAAGRTESISTAMERQIELFDQIMIFLDQAQQDSAAAIAGSATNIGLAETAQRELGGGPTRHAAAA